MPTSLDVPDILRDAGVPVSTMRGWETAGRSAGPITPRGLLAHDDVMPRRIRLEARLNLLRNGHSALRGPLCQVSLPHDGTWWMVASGRCNHAGEGYWEGVEDGNGQLLGVECAWAPGENYTPEQIDSLCRGAAALCRAFRWRTQMVAFHWEYARPRGRKADMHWRGPLRESVALHVLAQAGVTAAALEGLPPDFVEEEMPRPTDVVDEIEFGGGLVQLTYDGGTRFLDGATWPHEGPFSYPGLPDEARQGERGFYKIRPNDRDGFDLIGTDGARYSFPVA